jgi:hypothetical protein
MLGKPLYQNYVSWSSVEKWGSFVYQDLPLNFSAALGLSLFLSGCHFRAALR